MRKRLLLAVLGASIAGAVLAGGMPVQAQVPELLPVPNTLPQADRSDFSQRRDALTARVTVLDREVGAFNAACKSVDKGSAAAADCRRRFGELNERRKRYSSDANAFNGELRKKITHYERFPEPPSPFRFSGHGLIGGVGWESFPYAYNVPDNFTQQQKEAALRNFRRLFELAGLNPDRAVDAAQYNFILGLAISSNELDDLSRALRDNLKQGRATPDLQKQYEMLRGRSFEPLDCHSNGAMICLAALANNDIAARSIRLFGPQVTPGALAEWQSLLNAGKVASVEMFVAEGDPIPAISYGARYVLPSTRTTDATLQLVASFLTNTGLLKREIEVDKPGIKVTTIPCDRAGILSCHDMAHYQAHVR